MAFFSKTNGCGWKSDVFLVCTLCKGLSINVPLTTWYSKQRQFGPHWKWQALSAISKMVRYMFVAWLVPKLQVAKVREMSDAWIWSGTNYVTFFGIVTLYNVPFLLNMLCWVNTQCCVNTLCLVNTHWCLIRLCCWNTQCWVITLCWVNTQCCVNTLCSVNTQCRVNTLWWVNTKYFI